MAENGRTRNSWQRDLNIIKQRMENAGPVTVRCGRCGEDVRVISYGYGYLAACCERIIYSGHSLPSRHKKDSPGLVIIEEPKTSR